MIGKVYYITQTGTNVHNQSIVYEYLAVATDDNDEMILVDFEGFAYDNEFETQRFDSIDKVIEFIKNQSYMPYCDCKFEYKQLKNIKLDIEKCL